MNIKTKKILSESRIGFLLAVPALLVFSLIVLYPFLNSIVMSFTDKNLLRPTSNFVGFANYVKVFSDPNFPMVLRNTFVFVLFGTLSPFLGGLVWALLLNQKFRGVEFIRGLSLVCWIIPSTAIGFLWMWILHGHYGILNHFLLSLGIINEKITWLGMPNTAMIGVIIAKTWQTMPFCMAFILGGLQGISTEIVDSARIDGAGNWRVFWNIILPSIRNVLTIVLLLSAIGTMQHFDLLWVMTEGGPARGTTTLSIEVYNRAFSSFKVGEASTVGTLWTFILFIIGFFYLRERI
jgi:multiple sugar transport system permease protein